MVVVAKDTWGSWTMAKLKFQESHPRSQGWSSQTRAWIQTSVHGTCSLIPSITPPPLTQKGGDWKTLTSNWLAHAVPASMLAGLYPSVTLANGNGRLLLCLMVVEFAKFRHRFRVEWASAVSPGPQHCEKLSEETHRKFFSTNCSSASSDRRYFKLRLSLMKDGLSSDECDEDCRLLPAYPAFSLEEQTSEHNSMTQQRWNTCLNTSWNSTDFVALVIELCGFMFLNLLRIFHNVNDHTPR